MGYTMSSHSAEELFAVPTRETQPVQNRVSSRKPKQRMAPPMPNGPLSGLLKILILPERPRAQPLAVIRSMVLPKRQEGRFVSIGIRATRTPPVKSSVPMIRMPVRTAAGGWPPDTDSWTFRKVTSSGMGMPSAPLRPVIHSDQRHLLASSTEQQARDRAYKNRIFTN